MAFTKKSEEILSIVAGMPPDTFERFCKNLDSDTLEYLEVLLAKYEREQSE